jgi:hypothetical protein
MSDLKVSWRKKEGIDFLYFKFIGKLSEELAKNGISVWKEANSLKQGQKIHLVWDCLEMTGYDSLARVLWQKTMKDFKDSIGSIWILTNSNIVKVGATLLSAFTSFSIKIVSSENEVVF